MAFEEVVTFFKMHGREDIFVFDESSGTVEQAAKALGVTPDAIAKTLAFYDPQQDRAILVVMSGLTKISSGKFKRYFGFKPHMISPDKLIEYTHHPLGGVCPFMNPKEALILLDESLKKHDTVYPACGSAHSAIKLTLEELVSFTQNVLWVDFAQEG